jgi:hypothetical protein
MKLADLNTGTMENGILSNPNAASFPWNTDEWGGEIPRYAVIAELDRRKKAAIPAPTIVPLIQSVVLPRDLAILNSRPAKPFEVADDAMQKRLTVLIFTSHVPSHPHVWLLENVYKSVRRHMPNVRIVVLADGYDGLEPDSYTQFKQTVRERDWEIIEFRQRMHQSLMLKYALLTPGFITTPLVMVGEHDWGLKPLYIDWRGITDVLLNPQNKFKLIQIRQDMLGAWELCAGFLGEVVTVASKKREVHLLPTRWFQCPTHIVRCDWYRQLAPSLKEPDFLERKDMENALKDTGAVEQMACYIPDGPMGRQYHLNGREVKRPEQLGGIGGL